MTEPIKIFFIFWRVFGEFQYRKGPCENLVQLSMYEGHMESVEYLAEYLVHAWLNKLQISTPLVFLPHAE